jgi:adenosylmethionine-8-amino-7-oxononanoate aminotransferase
MDYKALNARLVAFAIGAVAGRSDVLDVMNPRREGKLLFPHSGTFSANPISMTAGLAAMRDVTERLRIDAEHVIFGHTHRRGPIGDEPGWEAAGTGPSAGDGGAGAPW